MDHDKVRPACRRGLKKTTRTEVIMPEAHPHLPSPHRHVPLQKAMPMLLSFIAGYVDSYTYLALFGLFAAQVTGSFVIAGAELVRHDVGVAGKLLAIVAFVVAAAITAALIA